MITYVWIGFIGRDAGGYVLGIVFILVALFATYVNLSFMCPLFRHMEHLRVPSTRFIFHLSLADFLFAVITALFLVMNMIHPLQENWEIFFFFLCPYLTFVSECLIILIILEQYKEICGQEYDREIRIRDCRYQPLVVWLTPIVIVIIVGALLSPIPFIFPSMMAFMFLLTFGFTWVYIPIVRKMNLDLHASQLLDDERTRLRFRNRIICVHLAMTVVFLGLTAASVFQLFFQVYGLSSTWYILAGSLTLVNAFIKPIIYVIGTPYYRSIFAQKSCAMTNRGMEIQEE